MPARFACVRFMQDPRPLFREIVSADRRPKEARPENVTSVDTVTASQTTLGLMVFHWEQNTTYHQKKSVLWITERTMSSNRDMNGNDETAIVKNFLR